METYFLKRDDIPFFYDRISKDYALYVPVKVDSKPQVKCDYGFNLPADDYALKRHSDLKKQDPVFNPYRCIEPVRSFLTHFKEEVGDYFKDSETQEANATPVAICGIKNCDIFALKVQDFVFLGGNEADHVYQTRREDCLIISGDCPTFKESCFCRAFGINPFATEGFDFNLSPLTDGYLLDVATEKAMRIIQDLRDILAPATSGQISGRQLKRETVAKQLDEHLAPHKIPKKEVLKEIVVSGYDSKIWQEQMTTCVECGGCIFICDTCHCFLLTDEKSRQDYRRLRIWDGCLLKNFSRVAGGANPLKMRYMRLRNRFMKKFDFFVDNIGFQACCGCGRCIEVCPGKIDIRYILKKLYEEKHLSAC